MARTAQYCQRPSGPSAGNHGQWNLGISDISNQNNGTDTGDTINTVNTPGIASNLYMRVLGNASSGTSTHYLRKNAGTTSPLTSPIGAGVANQEIEDTTHSDALIAGDVISGAFQNGGGGTVDFTVRGIIFKALNFTSATYGSFNWLGNVASTTAYYRFTSGVFSTTEAANLQLEMSVPGTFKNLNMGLLGSSTRSTDTNYSLRINGLTSPVAGTCIVAVPGGGGLQYSDTTHSDAVAVNDLLDRTVITGSGAGSCVGLGMFVFQTTNETSMYVVASTTTKTIVAAAVSYEGLNGRMDLTAAEASVQTKSGVPQTISQGYVYIVTNTITGAGSCTLRKGAADTAVTIPITGLTAGPFRDTTHSVSLVATDEVDSQWTGGAGGTSMTVAMIAYKTQLQHGALRRNASMNGLGAGGPFFSNPLSA